MSPGIQVVMAETQQTVEDYISQDWDTAASSTGCEVCFVLVCYCLGAWVDMLPCFEKLQRQYRDLHD